MPSKIFAFSNLAISALRWKGSIGHFCSSCSHPDTFVQCTNGASLTLLAETLPLLDGEQNISSGLAFRPAPFRLYDAGTCGAPIDLRCSSSLESLFRLLGSHGLLPLTLLSFTLSTDERGYFLPYLFDSHDLCNYSRDSLLCPFRRIFYNHD